MTWLSPRCVPDVNKHILSWRDSGSFLPNCPSLSLHSHIFCLWHILQSVAFKTTTGLFISNLHKQAVHFHLSPLLVMLSVVTSPPATFKVPEVPSEVTPIFSTTSFPFFPNHMSSLQQPYLFKNKVASYQSRFSYYCGTSKSFPHLLNAQYQKHSTTSATSLMPSIHDSPTRVQLLLHSQ